MSEERVWEVLCSRCHDLFEKYGNGIVIPPCNSLYDPVLVFDETDVECNVWRFVVYILWLEKHPWPFHAYCLVKSERPQSWKKSLVELATL